MDSPALRRSACGADFFSRVSQELELWPGLAEFVTVTGTNWGSMAAMATLTLIPSVIFVTLAQRYIVMGLTFGAVKE